MELTKEDWYDIVEEDLKLCNEKYDTLKILSVVRIGNSKGMIFRANYMTKYGDCSTTFGVCDIDEEHIPSLVRELKIKKILN